MTFPPLEVVLSSLEEVTDLPSIDADQPVEDLEIESIDLLEWLYVLEDEYSISIDDAQIEQLQPTMSIREIYSKISELALVTADAE